MDKIKKIYDVFMKHYKLMYSIQNTIEESSQSPGNVQVLFVDESKLQLVNVSDSESMENIDNMLKNENVTTFLEESNGQCNYTMTGAYEIDVSTVIEILPFWIWFPNNYTNQVSAKLDLLYLYRDNIDYLPEGNHDEVASITCETESTVLGGQKGFYIKIPNLYSYLKGYQK